MEISNLGLDHNLNPRIMPKPLAAVAPNLSRVNPGLSPLYHNDPRSVNDFMTSSTNLAVPEEIPLQTDVPTFCNFREDSLEVVFQVFNNENNFYRPQAVNNQLVPSPVNRTPAFFPSVPLPVASAPQFQEYIDLQLLQDELIPPQVSRDFIFPDRELTNINIPEPRSMNPSVEEVLPAEGDLLQFVAENLEPNGIIVLEESQDRVPRIGGELPLIESNRHLIPVGESENIIIDLDDFEKDQALQKFRVMQEMFPDADILFMQAKCAEYALENSEFESFILETMIPGNYPKKVVDIGEQNNALEITKPLDIEAFVKKYPDPVKHFSHNGSAAHYLQHVINYLLLRYRFTSVVHIRNALLRNNYNFYRSEVQIRSLPSSRRIIRRDSELKKANGKPPMEFSDTVTFIENEWKILQYLKDVQVARSNAVEEARLANALLECGCCFGDELLAEDVSNCTEGHIFCKECILRSSLVNMGDGKIEFPCLQDCSGYFDIHVLKDILPEVSFDKLQRKLQEKEVAAANIPGLVSCPFCEFSAILPDERRIFDCDNCKKQSCRLCRRVSHIPLRCDEVKDEEDRIYVEEKMTEALIRKCWKCGAKFIREDGCNKMTCVCGAKMCYICRQPVTGYSHFYDKHYTSGSSQSKCPLYTNNAKLHHLEVETEKERAINLLKRKNPNFNPDVLKKKCN